MNTAPAENGNGTPKSLQEAIDRALTTGPASTAREHLYQSIKDFLAQRIGTALMKAEAEGEQERLWALWAQITNEGERS